MLSLCVMLLLVGPSSSFFFNLGRMGCSCNQQCPPVRTCPPMPMCQLFAPCRPALPVYHQMYMPAPRYAPLPSYYPAYSTARQRPGPAHYLPPPIAPPPLPSYRPAPTSPLPVPLLPPPPLEPFHVREEPQYAPAPYVANKEYVPSTNFITEDNYSQETTRPFLSVISVGPKQTSYSTESSTYPVGEYTRVPIDPAMAPYEILPTHEQQRPSYSTPEPWSSPPSSSYTTQPTLAPYATTIYPLPPQPPSPSPQYIEAPHYRREATDTEQQEIDQAEDFFNSLKARRESETSPVPRTHTTCNSEKLGDAMYNVIVDDVSVSKRLVAEASSEAQDGERFDVFCAKGEFSYSIHARKYCEVTKDEVTCFAFR